MDRRGNSPKSTACWKIRGVRDLRDAAVQVADDLVFDEGGQLDVAMEVVEAEAGEVDIPVALSPSNVSQSDDDARPSTSTATGEFPQKLSTQRNAPQELCGLSR